MPEISPAIFLSIGITLLLLFFHRQIDEKKKNNYTSICLPITGLALIISYIIKTSFTF